MKHHTIETFARGATRGISAVVAVTLFTACASTSGVGSVAQPINDINPRAVQPERPTVATHAGTVALGYLEIEAGAEHDRYSNKQTGLQVPVLLKFGLASHAQLSVQLPLASASGISFGPGDASVGIKWRLAEAVPVFADVALLPSVKFSTGGDRGTGTTDAGLLVIDSRKVGNVGIDVNVGATWRSGDGSTIPKTSTLWTVSSGFPVHDALGWALEVYGYPGTSGAAGSAPVVALLTGPTWSLRPDLTLDFGVIAPIAGPQPRAVYVGVVSNVGRVFRR